MVRSSSSCFKIIACGGDAASEDGFERIESKGSTDKRENSTDKRGWSFRKKSDRHRKTTILEDSSAGNTENPDATGIDFHGQPSSTIVEKAFTSQREEVIPLSKDVSSKAPEILILQENVSKIDPIVNDEVGGDTGSLSIMKNADDADPIMDESLAIIIQAAIRGYLSQKALLKIKNVVKLQAAVRGHLVRSQAVGSLRCVQAIVKIQSFVRARRTRIVLEGQGFDAKLDDGFGESVQNPSTLEKERKEEQSFYCTEKLLRNAFARQLLESTSRKRPIHINCDPLRPDSTWRWLERWMSASSSSQESQLDLNNDKLERQLDGTVCGLGIDAPGEFVSETTKLNSCVRETTMSSDDDEDLTDDRDKFDFQFSKQAVSSKEDEAQQSQFDGTCLVEENKTSINKTEQPPTVASEVVVDSIPGVTEVDNEQLKHSMKRIALEEPEIEGKKVVGSKKASNPAFVAAQSKFKELSSTTMSTNSASKDMEGELKIGRILSRNNSQPKNAESTVSVNSFSHDPRFHLGESELDAAPRSSTTLDSPVRSEVRGSEKEIDSKVFEEVSSDLNRTDGKPSNMENQDGEFGQPASLEVVNGVASVVNVESRQSDTSAPNLHIKHDIPVAMAQPTYGSSPEGSIRSRLTVPESHGTPSSQVSVKAKRKESSKSDSAGKRKSKSADKRSPSNANNDPVMSDSMEKLSKDSKNGKRRNSFGATKTDHVDQEPRESNSASLPSYMQATKSARAKAQANNSPRSSPDVQDNDAYLKKRHSLPSAIGKQGSPRMPSSSPQAQQITKGDQSHSSRDKWQR